MEQLTDDQLEEGGPACSRTALWLQSNTDATRLESQQEKRGSQRPPRPVFSKH